MTPTKGLAVAADLPKQLRLYRGGRQVSRCFVELQFVVVLNESGSGYEVANDLEGRK
jgi:hypothetical protein